jgi:hypothetical protein
MWTTGDPRCSQCLWLSRSGWGQPPSSSPGRAAPRGFRYLSPARQQLVPIVVPKKESLPMAAQRRPAVAPPASLPPERGARPELRRRGSAATGPWMVPAGPGPGEWLLEPWFVKSRRPHHGHLARSDRWLAARRALEFPSPAVLAWRHPRVDGTRELFDTLGTGDPAWSRRHAVPGWFSSPSARARMHGAGAGCPRGRLFP